MNSIKLFQDKKIRSVWNELEQQWYFSVVDVVGVLSDSINATDYLKKMRKRDTELSNYIGTNCPHVEMRTETFKKRKTLSGNIRDILRIIQSILELIFTMLGERVTTEISQEEKPESFGANKKVAQRGGNVAGVARKQTEKELGRTVISDNNFLPDNKRLNRND
jgi:uncharacterized protein YqgV (UPF0045/DUF77 family)